MKGSDRPQNGCGQGHLIVEELCRVHIRQSHFFRYLCERLASALLCSEQSWHETLLINKSVHSCHCASLQGVHAMLYQR